MNSFSLAKGIIKEGSLIGFDQLHVCLFVGLIGWFTVGFVFIQISEYAKGLRWITKGTLFWINVKGPLGTRRNNENIMYIQGIQLISETSYFLLKIYWEKTTKGFSQTWTPKANK